MAHDTQTLPLPLRTKILINAFINRESETVPEDLVRAMYVTLVEWCRHDEEEAKQINSVYAERDKVVAALSKVFPSHITQHVPQQGQQDENWGKDWLNVVCIHMPTGQATWHIHILELQLFEHLKNVILTCEGYNGYTTEEKYRRVGALPVTWPPINVNE